MPLLIDQWKLFFRNVFGDHLGESSEFVSHVSPYDYSCAMSCMHHRNCCFVEIVYQCQVSLAFFTLNHCGVTAVLKNGGVLETIFHDHLEDFHKATKLIDFALCYTPN